MINNCSNPGLYSRKFLFLLPHIPTHRPYSKNTFFTFTLHRHFFIPFTTLIKLEAKNTPIGDSTLQPRQRQFLCGIWISSPPWPFSQASSLSSASKSNSKGSLWLVLHRSTYLGHWFKFPLVEHLLEPHCRRSLIFIGYFAWICDLGLDWGGTGLTGLTQCGPRSCFQALYPISFILTLF